MGGWRSALQALRGALWTACLSELPARGMGRDAEHLPLPSTLAWKIPWTEEPGRLQSMGSPRIGHDWATSLSRFPFMHWRRKWPPTPVFLPGESQGQGSLVGCRLWGRPESDTTEVTYLIVLECQTLRGKWLKLSSVVRKLLSKGIPTSSVW